MKKIVAKFEIIAYSDGNVEISGPIKDLFFYRQVMNKAEGAVLGLLKRDIAEESKIIQVKPKLRIM